MPSPHTIGWAIMESRSVRLSVRCHTGSRYNNLPVVRPVVSHSNTIVPFDIYQHLLLCICNVGSCSAKAIPGELMRLTLVQLSQRGCLCASNQFKPSPTSSWSTWFSLRPDRRWTLLLFIAHQSQAYTSPQLFMCQHTSTVSLDKKAPFYESSRGDLH